MFIKVICESEKTRLKPIDCEIVLIDNIGFRKRYYFFDIRWQRNINFEISWRKKSEQTQDAAEKRIENVRKIGVVHVLD